METFAPIVQPHFLRQRVIVVVIIAVADGRGRAVAVVLLELLDVAPRGDAGQGQCVGQDLIEFQGRHVGFHMAQIGSIGIGAALVVKVRHVRIGVGEQIAAIAFEPGVTQSGLEPGQALGRPQQPAANCQTVSRIFGRVEGLVVRVAIAVALFGREAEGQFIRDQRAPACDCEGRLLRIGDDGAAAQIPIEGRVDRSHHDRAGQGVQPLKSGLRPAEDFDLTHVPGLGRSREGDRRGQGGAVDIDRG